MSPLQILSILQFIALYIVLPVLYVLGLFMNGDDKLKNINQNISVLLFLFLLLFPVIVDYFWPGALFVNKKIGYIWVYSLFIVPVSCVVLVILIVLKIVNVFPLPQGERRCLMMMKCR